MKKYISESTRLVARIILTLIAVMALDSCGHMDDREIESLQSSGIVLVQNKSFFEVVLPNGGSMFFSSYDAEDGIHGLVFDADSVEMSKSFGTGFFVGTDGMIATNAHVISSSIEDKEVKKSVGEIFNAMKKYLEYEYDDKYERLEKIQDAYDYANRSSEVSYADFYAIRDLRDEAMAELREMQSMYKALDRIVVADAEIKYHNEVSIAYNDTHVTKDSDFIECVIHDKDSDHDLALIQLKNKHTPEDRYVFVVAEEDPFETYSMSDKITSKLSGDKNEKLYLHGFNLGPTLAVT
ncbi:MAG: hypothetical protein K2H85_09245, partial [Allobaculum sp.]|nr:hypothetical protein [Allobaculum sp.]